MTRFLLLISFLTLVSACGDGDGEGGVEIRGACFISSTFSADQCLSNSTEESCDLQRNSITSATWVCGATCGDANGVDLAEIFADDEFDRSCGRFQDRSSSDR